MTKQKDKIFFTETPTRKYIGKGHFKNHSPQTKHLEQSYHETRGLGGKSPLSRTNKTEDTTQQIKEDSIDKIIKGAYADSRAQTLEEVEKMITDLRDLLNWNYTTWTKEKWLEEIDDLISKIKEIK